MNTELNKKVEELNDEYDVELFTIDEIREFLNLDLILMKRDFEREIQWAKDNSDLCVADPLSAFVYGMKQGLHLAITRLQIRIDEGF